MTDRLKGVWVAFDADIREDDAAPILAAILQIRHVRAVTPSIVDGGDWINRTRVRAELATKLVDVLRDETKDDR